MDQKRCACCRIRFTVSRNPGQGYCGKPSCQKKRRCKYQKKKLKRDVDYKETHRSSQQKWRYKHPDYWRTYRLQHPLYVEANRLSQMSRDRKRRHQKEMRGHEFMLANMYSLFRKNNYVSYSCNINLGKENS
jgi:hypothetical protein